MYIVSTLFPLKFPKVADCYGIIYKNDLQAMPFGHQFIKQTIESNITMKVSLESNKKVQSTIILSSTFMGATGHGHRTICLSFPFFLRQMMPKTP